jgi:hypothetical protein
MIASIFGYEAAWSANLDFYPGGLRCIVQFYKQAKEHEEAAS